MSKAKGQIVSAAKVKTTLYLISVHINLILKH